MVPVVRLIAFRLPAGRAASHDGGHGWQLLAGEPGSWCWWY